MVVGDGGLSNGLGFDGDEGNGTGGQSQGQPGGNGKVIISW